MHLISENTFCTSGFSGIGWIQFDHFYAAKGFIPSGNIELFSSNSIIYQHYLRHYTPLSVGQGCWWPGEGDGRLHAWAIEKKKN